MKRRLYFGILVCLIAGLCGCKKENAAEKGKSGYDYEFVSEDYVQGGGCTVLSTDKGYYYRRMSDSAICYVDYESGTDMVLCNKPECRHDGNAFCVATNDAYHITDLRLYNGKLLATAIGVENNELCYKLLCIEPDGSELNELVTYYTMVEDGQAATPYMADGFQIHRNKVMLPFGAMGKEGLEDTEYYGLAVYDLDTKELTYVDEEPLGKEYGDASCIKGYKDWFFVCRNVGKKTRLYRYNINDKTMEEHELLSAFSGVYGIKDENTVIYLRCGGAKVGTEFYIYHLDTKENEMAATLKKIEYTDYNEDGIAEEREQIYSAAGMEMDESYIYVAEQGVTYRGTLTSDGEVKVERNIHIYTHDLEKVGMVNFADALLEHHPELKEQSFDGDGVYTYIYADHDLYYKDTDAYCVVSAGTETESMKYTYKCSKADLLAGKPVLVLVYRDMKDMVTDFGAR